MNLSDIRTRLAGLGGRTYWRSLEEYADTPEFREYLHREFPAQASEFTELARAMLRSRASYWKPAGTPGLSEVR